jgi:hypothetical protein
LIEIKNPAMSAKEIAKLAEALRDRWCKLGSLYDSSISEFNLLEAEIVIAPPEMM